jgi:hypothetical protein
MKKLIKPVNLLFYILTFLVFFMVGLTFGGITGAAEGQGLVGGAILFWYGIIFAFVAFIGSLFIAYHGTPKTVVVSNRILGFVFLIFIAVFLFRYWQM